MDLSIQGKDIHEYSILILKTASLTSFDRRAPEKLTLIDSILFYLFKMEKPLET